MKTLKEIIEGLKCRKGESAGTTKQGAFWLAVPNILIRRFGGDGIGQSSADCKNYLQLRHYRDGTVKALVKFTSYHQNGGDSTSYQSVPILDCTTVEDVIVILKGVTESGEFGSSAYSDWGRENLTAALTKLGLEESLPAPDEV